MNRVNKYWIFIVIIWVPFLATAQETWTLDRCIAFALENNLSIKNVEVDRDMQRISLTQARFNQLPSVGGNISVNNNYGRSKDESDVYSDKSSFYNSYDVGSSVILFSGFTQRNRIAFEKYNLKMEQNRVEQRKNLVIHTVIEAYFQYQFKKGIYSLAIENLKLMQDQHYSTQRMIEVGRKAESDIYDFDAKLANDSFLLVQQFGDSEKALLHLKSTMNYPFADTLSVDTLQLLTIAINDPIEIQTLVKSSKENLPDLKITENQLIASKKYLAQMRGNFSPSLELNAGWNTSYFQELGQYAPSFRNQFKNKAGEYVGLTLSIPIFSRFSKINNVKYAKLNYKKAEIAHQENVILLENEVNEAYIDWQTNKNEHIYAQKQLDKSKIAYSTAEKKLQLGQINVIEFYIQKNDMQRAKSELLRTQLQLALQDKYVRFLLNGKWEF